MHIPLVDGIMDKQNYHFAKPDADDVDEALSWAEIVHIEDPFPLSVQVAKAAHKKVCRLPERITCTPKT